jgi:hypothetical protein
MNYKIYQTPLDGMENLYLVEFIYKTATWWQLKKKHVYLTKNSIYDALTFSEHFIQSCKNIYIYNEYYNEFSVGVFHFFWNRCTWLSIWIWTHFHFTLSGGSNHAKENLFGAKRSTRNKIESVYLYSYMGLSFGLIATREFGWMLFYKTHKFPFLYIETAFKDWRKLLFHILFLFFFFFFLFIKQQINK